VLAWCGSGTGRYSGVPIHELTRDRLLAALRRPHEERAAEAIEVAVVYGAGHVPAIVTGLMRYGYRPRSGEWLTLADV
jgi:hypothetical protein